MTKLTKVPNPNKKTWLHGKQAFISKDKRLLKEICSKYGRDPKKCAIKVFYGNPLKRGQTLNEALWGDDPDIRNKRDVRKNTKLIVGTKIQNMVAKEGKAGRVYAVFEASYKDKRVACQLVEFLTGKNPGSMAEVRSMNEEIVKMGKKLGFTHVKNIMSEFDFIDGKCIDFQEFSFISNHKDIIRDIYINQGKYGKVYYQDVPELKLRGGPRKSKDRIKYLGLDKIDFRGKVVWDVGCAGGFFCRYADSRGAKRVIGFDEKNSSYAAFIISNYLGHFNIDYYDLDLRKGIPDDFEKPDIVFYFSMNYHIPTPKRIFEADTLILEDNGKESRNQTDPEIEFQFPYKKWQLVGYGKDHGNKPIYHLTR